MNPYKIDNWIQNSFDDSYNQKQNKWKETKHGETKNTYVECTGIAISSWPKKSFWNPSAPGLMIPATDGNSLPVNTETNKLIIEHRVLANSIIQFNSISSYLN